MASEALAAGSTRPAPGAAFNWNDPYVAYGGERGENVLRLSRPAGDPHCPEGVMGTPTHDAMTRLVTLARAIVAPIAHATVTMRGPNGQGLYTPWASTDEGRRMDELQYELHQGPCVQAVESGTVCHVVLGEAERHWPNLVDKVEFAEVGSVLATPLRSSQRVLGSLNLYSLLREPLDEDAQAAASELADLASAIVAMGDGPTAHQLVDAAASREAIARAEGVIMAWHGCSADEAFAILRRTSVRDNRPLRDVAEELLASVQRPSP